MKALEVRTQEDADQAFQEIEKLKTTVAKLIVHIEQTTGEKIKL